VTAGRRFAGFTLHGRLPLAGLICIAVLLSVVFGLSFYLNTINILLFTIILFIVLFAKPFTLLLMLVVLGSINFLPSMFSGSKYTSTFEQVGRDILLCFLFLRWVMSSAVAGHKPLRLPRRIWVPLMIWVWYVILRSFTGRTDFTSSIRVLRYIVLYPVILLIVVYDIILNERQMVILLRTFIIIGVLASLVGLADALFGFSRGYMSSVYTISADTDAFMPNTTTRVASFFLNANNFAGYLDTQILLLVLILLESKNTIFPRALILPVLVLHFLCLLVTWSRGAPLALLPCFMAIIYLLRRYRRISSRKIALTIVFIAILATAVFFVYLNTQAIRGGLADDMRVKGLPWFWNTFTERLDVFLTGYGTSPLPGMAPDLPGAGDIWLVVVAYYYGVIGVLLFVRLVVSTFAVVEIPYRPKGSDVLWLTSHFGIIYSMFMLVWSFASVAYTLFPSGMYTWIFVAVSLKAASMLSGREVSCRA